MNLSPEQITALSTGFVSILAALVAALQARSASKYALQSVEVTKTGNKVGREVHVLVNGANLLLLKELAAAKRRIADLTRLPDDLKAAEQADALVREHNEAQAVVKKGAV